MRRVLSLLFYFFCSITAFSQTSIVNPTFESTVPPSPSAAAIAKFGNTPVGPSTGIPGISVPVYSYANKGLGLSLNISLDYHAGGIRVNEKASDVGLGWALNAGGVITRSVRGIPDETSQIGFLTQAPLPKTEFDANQPWDAYELRPANRMYANQLDDQNDVFSFNFNGHSGQFVLGKNNDILVMPQSKIKVEWNYSATYLSQNGGAIVGFTITDERGYKYKFFDFETTYLNGSTGGHVFTSAWYLTQILTPAGNDAINFSYDSVTIQATYGRTVTNTIPLASPYWQPGSGGGFSNNLIVTKRVSSISFPDGVTTTFSYDTQQRSDLPGDFLLNKISISDGISQPTGVNLIHDYSLNRATLTGVTQFGGGTTLPPYTFTYTGSMPDLSTSGVSDAIDHWGFSNGNQGGLIPYEIYPQGIDNQDGKVYTLPGGNRNTDPALVLDGSLTKITYPTGGYTTFEMEANQASNNWLNQSDTVVQYIDSTVNKGIPLWVSSNDSYGKDTASIVLDQPAGSAVPGIIQFPADFAATCTGGGCVVTVEFHNSSNQILLTKSWTYNENGGQVSFSLTGMPNGVYKIYAYTNFGLTSYSGYLNISWTVDYGMVYHQTVYSNIQPYVGGLRVKTISDYNPDSTIPAQVRQYEYLLDDETTSSGALGAYPVYSYPVYYDSRCACHSIGGDAENYPNLATSFNYLVRSSSSINDIAGVNGSPVTYQRVTEKLINNGMSNGKTVRYFTSFTENPPAIVQVFPFIPPLFYEWAYGLLTREKIYDAQNNLLKETDNTYNYGFDSYFYDSVRAENFRSVTIAPVRFNYSTDQTIDEFNHPLISQFPLYLRMTSFSPWSGRAELAKSTVTEFTPSGALATYDSTEYDPQNFYMKRKLSTDSKGRQSVSLFTYPYDRVQAGQDPGGLYQQMLNLNMFNVNLSDSAARDGSTVSVKTANYFNPSGTLFVPQTINVQNGSFAPETRLTYNTYDTHGNVTGATASDGIPQTYIYGYNAQFPIAKVLNANPGDVAFTSFETGDTGGWTIGSGTYDSSTWLEGRKAFSLGSTVSKSGLSSSRTYVVSYWTQNSQPYTIAGTVSGYPVKGKTIAIGNGNWTLYEHRITGQTAISFSGSGYIDCLRLFPADAQMTTYTYSPLPGITTICTPDNKLTYYQYDELSRLQVIKDQDGNIIKTFDYHYNGQ